MHKGCPGPGVLSAECHSAPSAQREPFYSCRMEIEPDRRPRNQRRFFGKRTAELRTKVWSWLTDPAVLVYRREAHGRHRWRVMIVESFLFVREVSREFYEVEGGSRAAALAYTTLLSLIPLLVA